MKVRVELLKELVQSAPNKAAAVELLEMVALTSQTFHIIGEKGVKDFVKEVGTNSFFITIIYIAGAPAEMVMERAKEFKDAEAVARLVTATEKKYGKPGAAMPPTPINPNLN